MCSPTMGDTVLFSAVLLDLRSHFGEDVEIIHFCGKKNLLAAQLLQGADRRVTIDLSRPLAAAGKLRTERLDVLFDFSSWQRVTALLALASRTALTVGFQSPGQHRSSAYGMAIQHRADQHELENFRDLLRGAGIATAADPDIPPTSVALGAEWESETDVIILHLWPAGGSDSLREWPLENWILLAQEIAQPGSIFAITGSPDDGPRSRAFVAKLTAETGLRAAVFQGGDGLQQLVALMRKAHLVVSVNTGVMHLAAASGAPTISLNGPTSGLRWGPKGRCCAGVAPADGSGGYLHFGFEFNRHSPNVMEKITPEQVAVAARDLLAKCGHTSSAERAE